MKCIKAFLIVKSNILYPTGLLYFENQRNILRIMLLFRYIFDLPPHSKSSVIMSKEGVFYKFIMQIKIERGWSSIEVLNQNTT